MKKVLAFVAASTLLATSAMADEPVMSKFNMSIGGYVKLDYAYNSENLGASGTITPGGAGLNIAPRSANGMTDQSILGIRQSRLWVKVNGPDAFGAKTGGLIEGDFYGDPSAAAESPQFRARLAYGTLDWKNTSVLFGQYWDMFAPMVASTQDFRSGATTGAPNTPRIPMIKLTQRVELGAANKLEFVVAVQDPAQLGNNSNVAAGNPATTSGSNVNYAGQISFVSKALGVAPGYFGLSNKPLTITTFGLYGDEKLPAAAGAVLKTWGAGAYLFAPVLRSSDGKSRAMTMSLEGQIYEAANMSYNAATSGTLVHTGLTPLTATSAASIQPEKNIGLTAQLIFYPTQELGITAGYGARNLANKGSDMTATPYQQSNRELYINVAYDLNAAVRVAAEYQNLTSTWMNQNAQTGAALAGNKVVDNVNIARLCAYYFF